uniref:W2 domain-containing protein n=1 Tax=Leersia perrieri TaxID=77586 RepID=A0A0D9VC92_9ORYZ
MEMQNIGASNKGDAFYRYKMPKMITTIESRGNGIKTKIVNMVDIAKALARPASYITKYFSCVVGTRHTYDEKTGDSVVYGAHDTAKLSALLDNFIKKYVQCYGCGNPETEIVVTAISKSDKKVSLKCAACGYVSQVVDKKNDQFMKFVSKVPSEKGGKDNKAMRRAEKERQREGEAADEEQRRLKKESAKNKDAERQRKGEAADEEQRRPKKESTKSKGASSSSSSHSQDDDFVDDFAVAADNDDNDDDDDVQWQTDTSMEAAKQRMQAQLSTATAQMVMLSTDETTDKTKKGKQVLVHQDQHVPNLNLPNKATLYDKLVEEIKSKVVNKSAKPSHLKIILSSSTLPPQDTMNALLHALFDNIIFVGKGFAKEVMKRKDYLAAAVGKNDNDAQEILLLAIEAFCDKCSSSNAVREIPIVLKVLYDGDVLEEEAIGKWYEKAVAAGRRSEVVEKAKPFVEWLQSADSEDEED